jgi:hypothetical protein
VDRSTRAAPPWAWLAVVVVVSTVLRAAFARRMPGPFIFTDELTYSELAKSFAAGGHFLVRGAATNGYGFVYPVLISPAYRLFRDGPQAYAVAKAINSLLMSLAAVPAYLLARRMVGPQLSLLAGVLAVAIPSMAYTGTVMTENAFYPLFLVVVLQLVRVLERPTVPSQIALVVLVGVLFATRAQAVAVVPALIVAPPLLAWFERKSVAGALRPFTPLYAITVGGGVLLLGAQIARGRSLNDLLGAYSVVGNRHYSVRQVADFALWGAADLDLYLGVIPLVAAILLIARVRRETRPVQEFVATLLPLAVGVSIVVAAFNTQFADNRIEERNLFYLAPLLLIALVVWADRLDGGARRRLPLLAGAVACASLLPLTIPYHRFVGDPVRSDASALVLVWSAYGHMIAGSVYLTVGITCAILGLLALLVPRQAGTALPLLVLAWFALIFVPIFHGPHGFERSSAGGVFQGIRGVDRDWIDKAVPRGAEVAAVWSGLSDRFTIWQNEFFNRAVGTIYYVRQPTADGFPETQVHFGKDGLARTPDGRLVRPRYLLADGTIQPDGAVVARDSALGMTVWRLRGPLLNTTTVSGVYPDYWSGARVTWTRRHCRGGELRVSLYSDPHFFAPTTVAANGGAGRVGVRVAKYGNTLLRVPLPSSAATCRVRFDVSPVRVPKVVTHGRNPDPRALGTHFGTFEYRPAR